MPRSQTEVAVPSAEQVAYHGRMRLFNAESSHRAGYCVTFQLVVESDYEEFRALTKRRKNRAGHLFQIFCTNDQSVHHFEAQFYRWTLSNSGGAKVVFGLASPFDWQTFRELPALCVDETPAEWDVVIAEIQDDGTMVDQEQRERVETMRGGPVSMLAGRMGADPGFQFWVGSVRMNLGRRATPDECADFIREHSRIKSRVELDHDEAAKARFHKWVTKPYAIYRGQ